MKKNKLISCLLVSLMSTTIIGCDKNNNSNNSGDNNKSKDVVLDVNNIKGELEKNDDGTFNIEYLEGVEVDLWSVVGDPDKYFLEELVKKFNSQYAGSVKINLTSHSEEVYYNNLETKYLHNFESFPDACLMHNEVNIEYALRGFFYPLNTIIERTGVEFNFDNAYDNIERTTIYNNDHFGIPIDAHGYLTNIRQDIIKKNNLGFDDNTRFIPKTAAEYQSLLENLRSVADSGELWVRNINADFDHTWYQLKTGNPKLKESVTKDTFRPTFMQTTEFDGLSALYVNGGSLLDEKGNVNFQNCKGFERYITDQVDRYNNRLMGGGLKTSLFGPGNNVMFAEGPWWVANTYSLNWNNNQLGKVGERGITEEDANDPVYRYPYAVARPENWWATEDAPQETASKWYGNGHVITVSKKVTDIEKAAAILFFTQWLTQGQDKSGEYNLTTWCKGGGHVPAWQNVYESTGYQNAKEQSMTLKALGDPKDIIALESTKHATELILGLSRSVSDVHALLESNQGCTVTQAQQILQEVAIGTQITLDLITE